MGLIACKIHSQTQDTDLTCLRSEQELKNVWGEAGPELSRSAGRGARGNGGSLEGEGLRRVLTGDWRCLGWRGSTGESQERRLQWLVWQKVLTNWQQTIQRLSLKYTSPVGCSWWSRDTETGTVTEVTQPWQKHVYITIWITEFPTMEPQELHKSILCIPVCFSNPSEEP